MKTGVKVADAMAKKPIVVSPNEKVINCVKLMLKKSVGSLIVKENNRLVGILTEKDIVRNVVAKNLDANKILVKNVMTKRVVTITPDADIYDALMKMNKENIRRLPVVQDDKLVGFLTIKNILKIQPTLFELTYERWGMKRRELPGEYGECQACGSYGHLFRKGNKLVCGACV